MINRILSSFKHMQPERSLEQATEEGIINNNIRITLNTLFKNNNVLQISIGNICHQSLFKDANNYIKFKKINNFTEELRNYDEKIFQKMKEELPKRNEICLKNQQLKELESILKKLENHKYDPKCKFCILHPIVKQKREKELEIQELNKVIENLTKNLEISLEECNKIEEDELNKNFYEENTIMSYKDRNAIYLAYIGKYNDAHILKFGKTKDFFKLREIQHNKTYKKIQCD